MTYDGGPFAERDYYAAELAAARSENDLLVQSVQALQSGWKPLSHRENERLRTELAAVRREAERAQSELATWHAECDKVGVPCDPPGLVRHHRGNAALAAAAEAFTEIRKAEREAEQARAALADVDLIRRAICDPGQFLPRGNDYSEPITSWSARAVVAALSMAATDTEETP